MTAEQILKQHADPKYYGRIPAYIGETDMSPDNIGMKRLGRCRMIAAHFDMSAISWIWKSTCFKAGEQYYVIQTTDGTRFVVE